MLAYLCLLGQKRRWKWGFNKTTSYRHCNYTIIVVINQVQHQHNIKFISTSVLVHIFYFSAGKQCPEKEIAYSCTQIDGVWFHFGCPSYNFYTARDKCRRSGGDLTTLSGRNDLKMTLAFITEKKLYNHCSWFYVGLFTEEWVIQKQNTSNVFTFMLVSTTCI